MKQGGSIIASAFVSLELHLSLLFIMQILPFK